MTVALSVLALGIPALQEEGPAYDPSLLDPRVYGMRIEVAASEWRRVAVESVSSRLVYEPRRAEATGGSGGRGYARLRLARVPNRRMPELDVDWENVRIETVDAFRDAFPGGVQCVGAERVQVAGAPALEILLKLKEGDGAARTAVSTVFFHGGDAWRLELIGAEGAFERHLASYRSIRAGIAIAPGGAAVWLAAGGAALVAAVLGWRALWRRRELG